MTTRTAVLAHLTAASGSNAAIATVPVGEVWILKSWFAYNSSGSPTNLTLQFQAPGPIGYGVVFSGALAAGAGFEWEGWVALEAGHQLVVATSAAAVGIWCSGAKLVLPP